MVKLNSDSCKMLVLRFLMSVVVFVAVSFAIRVFASSRVLFSHYGDVLKSALCGSLVLLLWDFDRKAIKAFILFSVLYVSAAFIKLPLHMPLNSNEIVDTFSFAILICAAVLLLLRGLHLIKNLYIKRFLLLLFDIILVAALLPPIAWIGYYLLSGQLLTATIVLTLFQTNPSEAAAYIKDRGVILWCGGIAFALLFIGAVVYYINRIRLDGEKKGRIIVLCVLAVISVVLGGKVGSGIVDHVQIITVFKETRGVLKEYKEYGKAKEMRMEKLKQLAGLAIKPGQGGLYVLVIGESETRDHMHVYGYNRENTPWLSASSQKESTVLFKNAYSNHTHTVPVLTQALSGKNQYNSIKLSKAYSVMEVAKAAGYKTFWISNQIKYSAWDTPTAEMASTVDHEIWLNGNVGKSNKTQFYDEEVAKRIDEIKLESDGNIFLVCHLMGCHGFYADRYPAEFEKFTDVESSKKVSEYDNCVYYNDYVLKKIYEKVSKQKNFKAMIYFSDHGEEPDEDKSHEASKFTWQMARIPFVILFSESLMAASNNVYQTLRKNKDRYWTNDLLFDVLITMLGIQNAPDYSAKMDIGSDQYDMDKKQLKTLHGHKKIMVK